jgi:hypothetical protein
LEELKMSKTKIKWTDEAVKRVIAVARTAGGFAATMKLADLQEAGPAFTIHNEDFSGNRGPAIGTLLDICGGATLKISARGKFFQIAKRLSQEDRSLRFYCTNAYRGGGRLSIYDSTNRQEMSVNKAAADAHAAVLAEYGISARVETYID